MQRVLRKAGLYLEAVNVYLERIERAAGIAAALLMFVIMIIVACDVAMRYVFNRPFAWSYDLISIYLITALFYFSLSRTFTIHGHIGVDILQYYLPIWARRLCQIAVGLLGALLFALIAYLGTIRTYGEFEDGLVTSGYIEWPTWAAVVFVPIGSTMITLRLFLHALQHAISLASDRAIVALPPLAGTGEQPLLGH